MEWLIATYVITGIIVCVVTFRMLRKHEVDIPIDIPFFIIWPIIPVLAWLEIGAKRMREEEKERKLQEEEMKRTNPNYGLSTDEQIEKLRDIHNQLNKTGENQSTQTTR